LTAHAEGYAPAETRASAPTERATIFLTPESVIEGTVVHVESGMPVAGVTVSTRTGGFGSGANEAITDAEGRFRIASLTPGIYNLVARADELYGEGVEQVHLGLGQAVEDVVVEVHPAFAVAGKVVVAETSGPCSEGTVELQRVGQNIRAEIDEQGEVLVRAVLPGTYEVSVTCPGHVSEMQYEPIVVSDQNLVELEWKVHVGLAIRGVVVDAGGAPVVDVNVVASPRAIDGDPRAQLTSSWAEATDKQGNFDLQGLLPGTYELGVWATNQPSVGEPVVVELDKADVEGVRVLLPATGRLVGIVRDESGAAVPGVTITTSSLEQFRPSWGTTRTGDDGRFEIEALAAGNVRVRASSVRAAGTTDDDLQGEVVEIIAGSETHIELTVERRTQGIRGRVLDGSGAPVSDAFVDATRMSDSAAAGSGTQTAMRWGWDRRPVLSDHDGSFELAELAEGDYIVRAYREGGGEGVLEHVAAGSTGVEVVIAGTGELAGKVVLAGGGSPERFDVVASDRAQGLVRRDAFFRTDGGFVLRELVPGNYEVHATAPEGTAKTEVALAAGQSIDDLTIELVGKITVQGRIVDSDTRAPVPGLRVRVWGTAGSFTGSSNANELEHVTDSDGRFRVEGVSVGKVTVQVTPRNMGAGDSTYSWSRRTINLPSQPAVQDIGDFEVLRSRLAKNERPGDLGYTLARLPPETEPEDRYYEVAVIRPGGPADGSGLAIGDRIVEVDGRSVSGGDSSYYTLTMAPPGKSIVLGIEGGKQVTIVVGQPVQ
jgi:protocatechuate 3,4-dioxygenase beta subunit